MAKKKKSSRPVVRQIKTIDLGPGRDLGEPDGSWYNTQHYFVRKDPGITQAYFYRDLSIEYSENPDVAALTRYDESEMDAKFGDKPGSGMGVGPFKPEFVGKSVDWDPVFRAAFHWENDVQWRWPQPGEKIYHRPEGGWVGVWLEHLRSGYGPRCHQFVKSLCMFEYGLPITQLTPNAVKWIYYFLGCCEAAGLLPTFKLFHHMFRLVHSNNKPIFEFRFRSVACGYPTSASKPLAMLPSHKGWNWEFVFIRGVDIRFMPTFKEEPSAINFPTEDLEGEGLDRVYTFCRGLGRPVTRDDLMCPTYLRDIGCKCGPNLVCAENMNIVVCESGLMFCFVISGLPGYNPEFENFSKMSKTNENLLASLLKIGDVRSAGKAPGRGVARR